MRRMPWSSLWAVGQAFIGCPSLGRIRSQFRQLPHRDCDPGGYPRAVLERFFGNPGGNPRQYQSHLCVRSYCLYRQLHHRNDGIGEGDPDANGRYHDLERYCAHGCGNFEYLLGNPLKNIPFAASREGRFRSDAATRSGSTNPRTSGTPPGFRFRGAMGFTRVHRLMPLGRRHQSWPPPPVWLLGSPTATKALFPPRLWRPLRTRFAVPFPRWA